MCDGFPADGQPNPDYWLGAGLTASEGALALPGGRELSSVAGKPVNGARSWTATVDLRSLIREHWSEGRRVFELRVRRRSSPDDWVAVVAESHAEPLRFSHREAAQAMQAAGHFDAGRVGLGFGHCCLPRLRDWFYVLSE